MRAILIVYGGMLGLIGMCVLIGVALYKLFTL